MTSRRKRLIYVTVPCVAVGTALFLVPDSPEPPAETAETRPLARPRQVVTSPGDPPPSDMAPGEVRPGPEAGTLLVKPIGPAAPKVISSTYRVPSHRDDARVTRHDDGSTVFEQSVALALSLHSPRGSPEDDLQILDAIFAYYRLVYQMNPVAGENAEVMASLTGDNPHRIVVFPPDHPDLTAEGELLDRWGHPYFFHAESGTELDIWSAGPDQARGTADDVKLK